MPGSDPTASLQPRVRGRGWYGSCHRMDTLLTDAFGPQQRRQRLDQVLEQMPRG